jgi:hypothetical protein
MNIEAFEQAVSAAQDAARFSDFDQHVLFNGTEFTIADDRSLDFGDPVGAIKMATCEGRLHGDY